jgi:hypothetical protein
MKAIWRHGYDKDVEVIFHSAHPDVQGGLIVEYTTEDGISHEDHIEMIVSELGTLILFTPENW